MYLEIYFRGVMVLKTYLTPARFKSFWRSVRLLLEKEEVEDGYEMQISDGISQEPYIYYFEKVNFIDVLAKIVARISVGRRVYNCHYIKDGGCDQGVLTLCHKSLMEFLKKSGLENKKESFPGRLRLLEVWIEKDRSNVFLLKHSF